MSEHAGEDAVDSDTKGGSAAEWAVERAEELEVEPHEFLERMIAAYRAVETTDGEAATVASGAVADLRESVDALEEDLDEMIADVRDRVIQVKREADGKAPADHSHEELTAGFETLQEEVETLSGRVDEIADQLEGGFENFEEILEFLVERSDEHADQLETLGKAVVALQETTETVTAREHARSRADRLKKKGAKSGVRTAKCEDCGSKVDLAMLSEASCPACDATFQDIDPDPGFFGRSVLETGSRPALEAPSDVPSADEIESVAAGGTSGSAPDRDEWFTGLDVTEDEDA